MMTKLEETFFREAATQPVTEAMPSEDVTKFIEEARRLTGVICIPQEP